MSPRRFLTAASAGILLVLLLLRQPPAELRGRLAFLRATAALPLAARRIAAASSDSDRRYVEMLVWGRGHIPPRSAGVAVIPDTEVTGRRSYLAIYYLAPVPVAVLPASIPSGWLALVHDAAKLPGWRVVAQGSAGALVARPGPAGPAP